MRAALFALLLLGCHHADPGPKMEPGEVAPLPPASGTPIGVLVDSSSALLLRDDQVAKLREIDEGVAARNASIDAQMRASDKPPDPASPPAGGGHHGGGMHMSGGGGGRHHRGQGSGSGSGGGPAPHAPSNARLENEKSANNRDALARAFAILDPDQRVAAKKLLDDRGIDASGVESDPDSPEN